jgi:Fic family protein
MTQEELDFLRESNAIENEPFEGSAKDEAIEAWEFVKGVEEITLEDVLHAHELIMESRNTIYDGEKGSLTKHQTGIYSGGRLIRMNPNPSEVPELIERWIGFMNDSVNELEEDATDQKKEQLCIDLHVEYEKIHPFSDGCGRTGRLWYNWHRLKYGLPIHVIWAKDKRSYFDWFA